MTIRVHLCLPLLIAAFVVANGLAPAQHGAETAQGIFQNSTDVGTAHAGSSSFDPATRSYTLNGGGDDVWGTADDFRFSWTQISGDLTLSADVLDGHPSTHPKAKGMLMIRQSLDRGSPYADVAIHGDGHIDLQWRATQGGETRDTDLPEHSAVRLRIERKGDHYTAYALTGGMTTSNAPSITIPMRDPVYVGIGVCSHNTEALQTVTFSNVAIDRDDHIVRAAQVTDR